MLRLPLGVRLWRTEEPSACELALELLRSARHRLRCRPEVVLFDAWSPSRRRLQQIHDGGKSSHHR